MDDSEASYFTSDVKRIQKINIFEKIDSEALKYMQGIFDKYGMNIKVSVTNLDYYNDYIDNIRTQYTKSTELIDLYDSFIVDIDAILESDNISNIQKLNDDIRSFLPFSKKITPENIVERRQFYVDMIRKHTNFIASHDAFRIQNVGDNTR